VDAGIAEDVARRSNGGILTGLVAEGAAAFVLWKHQAVLWGGQLAGDISRGQLAGDN
jgi:hypothetical protein